MVKRNDSNTKGVIAFMFTQEEKEELRAQRYMLSRKKMSENAKRWHRKHAARLKAEKQARKNEGRRQAKKKAAVLLATSEHRSAVLEKAKHVLPDYLRED